MTRQVRAAVAVLGVLGLVLVLLVVLLLTKGGGDDSATTSGDPTSPPTSSGAASPSGTPTPGLTDDAPAGLEKFYGQTLDWTSCGGDKQCAKLTVPLDYSDPSGETIQLNLARVQATDPSQRVGSLVVNPGGPGAAGTTMVDDPSFYFTPDLLAREDIVAFDPRGTGDSDPVHCLTDHQLDAFIAEDPTPDNRAAATTWGRTQQSFFRGCQQMSGDLVDHISTVEAARDMDVLRAALGEQQLSYLGFSYGTKLGATYASLFPAQVGRLVLDGAVDPDLSFKQASLVQAGGFQTALDSYVKNCIDQGSCFLGGSEKAALAKISNLLDQIDSHPLPTDQSGRQLTVGNAFYGVATPLYNRDYWPLLDQALQAALNGDGSALLRLSDAYASRNPDGSYADNSAQAFPAISCLDDHSSVNPQQVFGYYQRFEKVAPTFGRVFAWGLAGCYGENARPTEQPPTIKAAGAAPIVVIGTTRDPATPFSEARSLAKELDSGVLLSRDGDGHTAYNKGNSCIDDAVDAYLLEGTVPQNGLKC